MASNTGLNKRFRALERALDARQQAEVAELAGALLAALMFASNLAEARASDKSKEVRCAQLSRRSEELEKDHASLTDCNTQLVNACDELGKGVHVQMELLLGSSAVADLGRSLLLLLKSIDDGGLQYIVTGR